MEYFIAVAEELHFGRAAKRLHIAQPGLSQQIKVLETELGVTLLQRGPAGVRLTDEGSLFLEDAREIVNRTEAAVSRVRAAAAGFMDRLRFLHTRSAPDLGHELIARFRLEFPSVEVIQEAAWTARNLEWLRSGEADAAIVRLPLLDAEDIEILPLSSAEIVVVLPDDHPLATKRTLTNADLLDQAIVEWPRLQAPGAYDVTRGHVWGQRRPNVAAEEPDADHILVAVANRAGIALLDAHRAIRLRRPGTILRRLENAPLAVHGLASRRGPTRGAVALLTTTAREMFPVPRQLTAQTKLPAER